MKKYLLFIFYTPLFMLFLLCTSNISENSRQFGHLAIIHDLGTTRPDGKIFIDNVEKDSIQADSIKTFVLAAGSHETWVIFPRTNGYEAFGPDSVVLYKDSITEWFLSKAQHHSVYPGIQ
jgi:hypothetical protein